MATYQELKSQGDALIEYIRSAETPQVFVGTATCGRAAGALEVLDAIRSKLASLGIRADVYEVGCTGLCFAEPQVDIISKGKPRIGYRNMTPELVTQLLEDYFVRNNSRTDLAMYTLGEGSLQGVPSFQQLPELKLQVRIAMRNCGVIDPTSPLHYIGRGGYAGLNRALTQLTPQQVLEEVQKSGLLGRGGAAFPTGQKWSLLAASKERVKYHLCNAQESTPGAFNDKTILESDPFSVIEGMTIGGYATAAPYGYIFIRTSHKDVIRRVDKALQEAYRLGLLGMNILGSSFSYDIEVAETGEAYVAGEETALIEAIEGKRAMPRFRPPFPAQVGLWGKPSNVNNVKSYSYVPEILAKGAAWYAGIGTEKSKGTALICLSGNINKPGLAEVPFGVTIRQVLQEIGGGALPGRSIKVLQTGGPPGGFLSASELDTPVDFDQMAAKGTVLGSGGIIVGDDSQCMVDLTKVLADFNHEESCGKCFPCRLGTKHMLNMVVGMSKGWARPGDVERMLGLTSIMMTSLCGHGQLAVNPIKSAVQYFGEEIKAHVEEKRCPTGRGQDLGRK